MYFQTGPGSDYEATYGVKLKSSSRTTGPPSPGTTEGLTTSSDGQLDGLAAASVDRLADGIHSSASVTDSSAISDTLFPYDKQKQIPPGDLSANITGIRASKDETNSQSALLGSTHLSVHSKDNVTHASPKRLNDDTLFFDAVESWRPTNTSVTMSQNVQRHEQSTESDAGYPGVDLEAFFREYARREGVSLNNATFRAMFSPKSTEPSSRWTESLHKADLSKVIAQGRPEAVGTSQQQGEKIPGTETAELERTEHPTHFPEETSSSPNLRGRVVDNEPTSQSVLPESNGEDLKVQPSETEQKNTPLKMPPVILIPKRQRTDVPVVTPLHEYDKEPTSAILNKEESEPAPAAIALSDQQRPMYHFRRFRYSAPVMTDGEPKAFVYVDESSPQRHIVVSDAHFDNGGDNDGDDDDDDDVVRTTGRGHQLRYANAVPTVHGGVVYVYEDDGSPPAQVVIPCNGCRSRLGFLSVVGDHSPVDVDDEDSLLDAGGDTSLTHVEGTHSESGKLGASVLFAMGTSATRDVVLADDATAVDQKHDGDTEVRDLLTESTSENSRPGARYEPRLGRSSNATQSRKSVKISGFYETKGPVGHLHLAGGHGLFTFSGHIPHFSDSSMYYLPLPGTRRFLPTAFSYNPGVFDGHSFSGNIKHPITSYKDITNEQSGLTAEDSATQASFATEKVDRDTSDHLRASSLSLTSKLQPTGLPVDPTGRHSVEKRNTRFSKSTASLQPTGPFQERKQGALDHRQRRATFQKVRVPRRRRPVTSTPRPPQTLTQLTRGQRYTVLNDIHANMRQSRRLRTSTPRPVVTSTTESDQELREQTLQMIRDLRDEELVPRSDSAKYKAALTAQLKKQLQSTDTEQSEKGGDQSKNQQASNFTATLALQTFEDSRLVEVANVISDNSSEIGANEYEAGGSTPLLKAVAEERKIQSDISKELDSNEHQSNKNESDTVNPKQARTEQTDEETSNNSIEKHTTQKSWSEEREIKKAERNAALAIQLKEKLLREFQEQEALLLTADSRRSSPGINVRGKTKLSIAEISSTAPASLSLNSLALAITKPKNEKFGADQLSNFGKAINSFNNMPKDDKRDSPPSMTSLPVTKDLRDSLVQNSVDVGTPEDYARHLMLYEAINDGTFVHVTEVEQTLQDPEVVVDESVDVDREQYPFGSSLALPDIVDKYVDVDDYEIRDSYPEDITDTPEITESTIPEYADFPQAYVEDQSTATKTSGFETSPGLDFNSEFSNNSEVSPLSEGGLSLVVDPIPDSQATPVESPDHPESFLKALDFGSNHHEFSENHALHRGKPKHRRPHSRPAFPESHGFGRPGFHAKRPVPISGHPRFRGEHSPGIRPGAGGRPRPGMHSVPADRPNIGILAAEDTDDGPSGDVFESTDLLGGLDIGPDENESFASESESESRPKPSSGLGHGPQKRPGHGAGPGHHHGIPGSFRQPGPGHRPRPYRPPRPHRPHRPPPGFFRRMYHRMMHGFHRMMSRPRRFTRGRRRPLAGGDHDLHSAYRPRGMRGMLGIYRGGRNKPEEDDS